MSAFAATSPELLHAPIPGHLQVCDFCADQEAATFAECVGYDATKAPDLFYLAAYYSSDGISSDRIERIRTGIVTRCNKTPYRATPIYPVALSEEFSADIDRDILALDFIRKSNWTALRGKPDWYTVASFFAKPPDETTCAAVALRVPELIGGAA
jgi:hypothetical protein